MEIIIIDLKTNTKVKITDCEQFKILILVIECL